MGWKHAWDLTGFPLVVSILLIVGFYRYRCFNQRNTLPLPPGPTPLPVIGNLHQFRGGEPWKILDKWHEKYGPLITIRFGQRTAIVIGSNKIAHDMLDTRSALYSSRPRLILAFELLTQGLNMGIMPYTEQWRVHNRIATSLLSSNLVKRYQHLQDRKSVV